MRLSIFCFLCGALMAAQSSFAFVAPHKKQYERLGVSPVETFERVLRPDLKKETSSIINESGLDVETHLDTHSGAIRLLSGRFVEHVDADNINASSLIQLAKDFVDAHYDIFGISSKDLEFVQDALYVGEDTQFVQFRVKRDGVLIKDAGIDFRFKRGHLVQIVNDSYSEAPKPSVLISSENLAELVAQATHAQRVERKGFHYRVENIAKGYQLIKVAIYRVVTQANDDLTVEINTTDGKIFELKDNKFYVTAKATADIYPRWYNETLTASPLPFHKFEVAGLSLLSDANGVFETPSQPGPSITQGLGGSFAVLSVVSGTPVSQQGVFADNEWKIHVARTSQDNPWLSKDVAQSMVYYHTTAMVQEALRFVDTPWLHAPLKANVNLNSTCNAHWDGRSINLYSGNAQCANTGLISDVVYHEWGHGLDAMTGGIQDGAFSEGYGDIMSLLMTKSSLLGVGFFIENHAPVRELATDRSYPQDKGEVHHEGLIIGSTFWDLFEVFAAKYGQNEAAAMLKNYAFKMIFTARTYRDVYQAILVIDDNDTDLTNGTPNKCKINEVFTAHGLADRDISCSLASVDRFQVEDSDSDGIISPGERLQLGVIARNSSNQTLVGLRASVAINNPSIFIENGSIEWNDILPGTARLSSNKIVLQVSDQAVCGSRFSAKLHLLGSESREAFVDKDFFIGKNVGVENSFLAQGLPLPVLDYQTVEAPIAVSGDQWSDNVVVDTARLKFDITHSYTGDLTISLQGPQGNSVQVYKGQGAGTNISFDQDISSLVQGFVGLGVWKLKVTDSAHRDEGALNSFELKATPRKFSCR